MQQWDGISEFVAVAESRSFTKAAKQLQVSTAQVSRQVARLEQRLDTILLHRTTRAVVVTEAGQLYYQHCRQLLDGLAEAGRALTEIQDTPRGMLTITAPTIYGERKIAPLLNDFLQEFPKVELKLVLTNQTLDIMAEGIDLAIRLGKLENCQLVAKRLANREQHICASPEYFSRMGVPHTLADLSNHNCLLGTLDYWRFQVKGEERMVKVSGTLRCNSGYALLDAAYKGIGMVQLPDYYLQEALKSGELVEVLRDYQNDDEAVWALYPQNRHLSLKVKMLLTRLSEHLGSL